MKHWDLQTNQSLLDGLHAPKVSSRDSSGRCCLVSVGGSKVPVSGHLKLAGIMAMFLRSTLTQNYTEKGTVGNLVSGYTQY